MTEGKKHIPVLAITLGDPAGIGPEIAAKILSRKETFRICNPILIGHSPSMHAVINNLGLNLKLESISNVSGARFKYGTIDLIDIPDITNDEIIAGKVSANAGDIAFRAIRTAIGLAMKKEVDGIVTGPIQKEALNLAGHRFSGHTEIFAHYTNAIATRLWLSKVPKATI